MVQIVAVQAVAIALLALLVAGLLRSHAEILRTLHRLGAGLDPVGGGLAGPTEGGRVSSGRPAGHRSSTSGFDVVGTTLTDEVVRIGVVGARRSTLLAFLSSGCFTCAGFWDAFRAGDRLSVPGAARLVIVTKGAAEESESRLRELAPSEIPVVMSTAAWDDYQVPVAPYFVYVDGPSGQVSGQGVAQTWPQVVSLWSQALDDAAARADAAGEARADHDLMKAGIHPGHPSLYPARHGGDGDAED